MKYLFGLAALGMAAFSSADLYVNTFATDVDSFDAQGSAFNVVQSANLGVGSHITGIGWDLNLRTLGASWLSEAVIGFGDGPTGAVNLTPGIGDDFSGGAAYSSGGVVDLVGLGLDFFLTTGNLNMEFFESFDDGVGAVDSKWLAGSALTIQYTSAVPEPASFAVLGLGVAVLLRRRRKN